MDVVLRFALKQSAGDWLQEAERVLDLFSIQPGFQSAKAYLALDDDATGLLYLQFDSVGNYRRALSAYAIKVEATQFLSESIDEPSAFEVLLTYADGKKVHYQSEKTASSEEIALGDSATARAQSRLEQ